MTERLIMRLRLYWMCRLFHSYIRMHENAHRQPALPNNGNAVAKPFSHLNIGIRKSVLVCIWWPDFFTLSSSIYYFGSAVVLVYMNSSALFHTWCERINGADVISTKTNIIQLFGCGIFIDIMDPAVIYHEHICHWITDTYIYLPINYRF